MPCKYVINSTTDTLSSIRNDENQLNNFIDSAIKFSEKMGISPLNDFNKHHRRRVTPKKIDDERDNAAD